MPQRQGPPTRRRNLITSTTERARSALAPPERSRAHRGRRNAEQSRAARCVQVTRCRHRPDEGSVSGFSGHSELTTGGCDASPLCSHRRQRAPLGLQLEPHARARHTRFDPQADGRPVEMRREVRGQCLALSPKVRSPKTSVSASCAGGRGARSNRLLPRAWSKESISASLRCSSVMVIVRCAGWPGG